MTDFLWLTRDYRVSNSSSILAVFRFLRRQPWKVLSTRTWNIAKSLLQLALVAASLGSLFSPLSAYASSSKAVEADIPFKFNVGSLTFPAGQYHLVSAGPGVFTLRDAHYNFVASFFARSIENGNGIPTSKLVFKTRSEHPQLNQIWIEDTQKLELTGGEVAIRRSNPAQRTPSNVEPSFETRSTSGLKN